ncbi:ubiquinol-cytochrome c reductase iron-sulfur subunit [Streptomyces sp. NPDC049040]|uniref:QcrA and Rieske domain-containing protein n=1 Tax=Streptomyces sp. NPDC049040 TaxID=3365593 RepID=UPI003716E376
MKRDVMRFVDSLLRQRRPRAFTPDDEDVPVMRTAIALAAGRPEADRPREEFVEALRGRLAAEQEQAPTTLPRPRGVRAPRRRLLQAAAVAASAFVAGVFVDRSRGGDSAEGSTGTTEGSAGTTADAAIVPSVGVWRAVVPSSDLAEGAVLSFDLGAVVGVVRRESGRLRAVSSVCTHQACRLGLNDARDTLVCPCHGATFSVQGAPLHNMRSSRPLPALPRLAVREFRGHVQVYCPADTAGV